MLNDPHRRNVKRLLWTLALGLLLGGLLTQMEIGQTKKADNAYLTGRKLTDLAVQRGVEPVEAMLDLAVEEDLETEFCLTSQTPRIQSGSTRWSTPASPSGTQQRLTTTVAR